MRRIILSAAAALAGGLIWGVAASATQAAEMRPILTMEVARIMADACIAKSNEEGWRMHIAVVDNGGNLKYYTRMDDSIFLSQDIAIKKATTSASGPFATKQLGQFAFNEQGQATAFAFVDGLIFFEGGLPIMAGGTHVGGIGVSGGTGEQDGMCAQAGLDAAASMLE